jgi:pimeloyl-ACP methyl ester carboxylesterase
MKKKIKHMGQDIYFATYGKAENPAIFFLHGYLESLEIWDDFAHEFTDDYYVVCIDLPGHGDSESLAETQTMGAMAYAVKDVADSLDIKKLHLVGHSMGGYVTMAFRDKFPDMLSSYVLFHSTCFSDTDEKRINRDREIELVRQGKKDLIVNTHITKAFADSNLKKMEKQVEKTIRIALKTKENGIISALNGMKMRADRCLLIVAGGIPLLVVASKMDNFISIDVVLKMKKMANNTEFVILRKSGHMGFIEEKDKAGKELKIFFNSIRRN